jgi:hypothetical protein
VFVYGMAFEFLIFQVHLLKLLPTLEYVLAHRVVYDDVKRIWGFLWWDFQRNSYNFYSRWSSGTGITFGSFAGYALVIAIAFAVLFKTNIMQRDVAVSH